MPQVSNRVRRSWTPLNIAYSCIMSGAENQNYNGVYQSYDPDRKLVPLEILIQVEAIDPKRNITPGIINSKLTDVRWYENSISEANNILDSNTNYIIDRNGATNNRGKITVKVNTPLEGIVLIFTAKYTDPRNNRVVNVSGSKQLGVTVSTDEPLRVKVDYPLGQVVDPTEEQDFIQIDNTLLLGNNEYEGSIYTWQKKAGANHETLTEGQDGIIGTFSGKLQIPCPVVGKRMDLRCIADVLPDLTGVNLISKKMISTDWNAVIPGCSTPGQDADGKYFEIDQLKLYKYAGFIAPAPTDPEVAKDLFGIKYKTNQQYNLSVRWKMKSSQASSGFAFIILYTDGTINSSLALSGNSTSVLTQLLTTTQGKTVRKIYFSFGSSVVHPLFYDIQLAERDNAINFVSGGLYNRVPATGMASGAIGKGLIVDADLRQYLTVGRVITVTFMNVINIAGTNSITFSYKDNDGVQRDRGELTTGNKAQFTINHDGTSGTGNIVLTLGNRDGATEYWGTMLALSSIGYKYCPANGEFLPAIPDGAPRPSVPSSKAIVTDHVLSTSYPKPDLQAHVPGLVLDDVQLIPGSVSLKSNRGDIVNPQHYWSFPWRDKTGAIFARGSRILIDSGMFENDVIDYKVNAIEGLSEAKWAANFNGIDQFLRNVNPPSALIPWGPSVGVRTHVIDFILDSLSSDMQIPVQIWGISGNAVYGFALGIVTDGRLQYRVGREKGATTYPAVYYGETVIKPNVMYTVRVIINTDGTYSSTINGIPDSFRGTGGAEYSAAGILLGVGISKYFSGKILKYSIIRSTGTVEASWDFQPNDGDRSNMLKAKNGSGVPLVSPSSLSPINISNIDDTNPATGFFTTI